MTQKLSNDGGSDLKLYLHWNFSFWNRPLPKTVTLAIFAAWYNDAIPDFEAAQRWSRERRQLQAAAAMTMFRAFLFIVPIDHMGQFISKGFNATRMDMQKSSAHLCQTLIGSHRSGQFGSME